MNMEIEWVPITELRVDVSYQRRLDPARVKKYFGIYNPALLTPLSVARRSDGSLWVWDGQHRLALLKMLGEDLAPCFVIESTGLEDEAGLFIEAQKARKALTQMDTWKAKLARQDPVALEIKATVEACGFRVGTSEGHIAAIAKLYHLRHRKLLTEVLTIIANTWRPIHKRDSVRDNILGGLGCLLFFNSGNIDIDRLERVMVTYTPRNMMAPAQSGQKYDRAVASNLATIYNARLPKKLKPLVVGL